MKLFLRIPTAHAVDYPTADWLAWVCKAVPDIDAQTHWTRCYGIAEGRNEIVRDFLKTDCTHLWMVDADTVPPRHLKMLETAQEWPVVAGPYNGFSNEHGVTWHVYKNGSMLLPSQWPKKRVFKVDAMGTGNIIIQRHILESMSAPWFQYSYREDGSVSGTEDTVFCSKVGGVWADREAVARHYREVDLLQAWNTHAKVMADMVKGTKQ